MLTSAFEMRASEAVNPDLDLLRLNGASWETQAMCSGTGAPGVDGRGSPSTCGWAILELRLSAGRRGCQGDGRSVIRQLRELSPCFIFINDLMSSQCSRYFSFLTCLWHLGLPLPKKGVRNHQRLWSCLAQNWVLHDGELLSDLGPDQWCARAGRGQRNPVGLHRGQWIPGMLFYSTLLSYISSNVCLRPLTCSSFEVGGVHGVVFSVLGIVPAGILSVLGEENLWDPTGSVNLVGLVRASGPLWLWWKNCYNLWPAFLVFLPPQRFVYSTLREPFGIIYSFSHWFWEPTANLGGALGLREWSVLTAPVGPEAAI